MLMVTYQRIAQLVAVGNGLQSTAFIAFLLLLLFVMDFASALSLVYWFAWSSACCGELPSGVLAGLPLAPWYYWWKISLWWRLKGMITYAVVERLNSAWPLQVSHHCCLVTLNMRGPSCNTDLYGKQTPLSYYTKSKCLQRCFGPLGFH